MEAVQIREVRKEKSWEVFLLGRPHTPFLQSWAWGEFQEKIGASHHRLGIYRGDRLVGVCLALVGRRRLGKFVYVPHGPVLEEFHEDTVGAVLEYLKGFAEEEGADYLRIEPPWKDTGAVNVLTARGFRRSRAPTGQAGGRTLLLDLDLGEEELLAGMRKTTRYLVRKALEMGVQVHRTSDPQMMNEFHRLMGVTRRRQGFVPHSRRYLQTQFETLAPRRMTELSLAEYQGNILAASITISYGDTASYIHGASARSEVPASYLLLWENIREARKEDFRYFDFWGIAPTDNPKHPWYGYSLFKRGFGGYPVDYLGSWDYVLNPRYWVVSAVERTRRIFRRL
ncbi:MAG: peptidoglycan bridge formation glycyltransferase FemA/FemB family protein [Patescibacteria group bacterium]|nr:MAG: peptidoglycan bridge formation glycyltransferase FemA/FemB family protein [Patescibacteria group bacterium]